MEMRSSTLLRWMNKTFEALHDKNLINLVQLKDSFLLEKIMIEIDEKYFGKLNLLLNQSESSQAYNLTIIYKEILKFYKEIIGIQFEEEFFLPKDFSQTNFRKLAELITGMAAQCDKRGIFLQSMQNMDNEDSTELFTILTERISAYSEDLKLDDFQQSEHADEEEQTALYLRIESLEMENAKLQDEITILRNKVAELTKENYVFELTIKEVEGKYQELMSSVETRNSVLNQKNDFEESVNLSIQVSELRGKLEGKEKNIQRLKEDKEKIIDEYKMKILSMQKENDNLREKSIKYDVLKEKLHALDEINNLKAKIIQSERTIKDQDEKIKKLKNFDADRCILLKKIEDLHVELTQEKENYLELNKQIDYYKDTIIQYENEIKFFKKQIDSLKIEDNLQNVVKKEDIIMNRSASLCELEEEANAKRYLLELEAKVKYLQSDKDNFSREKSNLIEQINELNKLIEQKKIELEKYFKKDSKYSKNKEVMHSYIVKISDLMEKLHNLQTENENLKFLKGKEISELESNLSNTINNQNQKHNEELFSLKEIINKYENENNYMKKEIKKSEELIGSNKLYIEELQRKINNPHSENKIIEIEMKLKEITTNENIELKKAINEKDENINKLKDQLKIYDMKTKEYLLEIEKLKKMSEELASEEIKKKDETINYYKTQVQTTEKNFNNELQLVSSLFHQLAFEYNLLQSKMEYHIAPLNFNIDKL